MKIFIIGDNIELIKNLNNDSINLIYFDPPYNVENFYNFNDNFKSVEDYLGIY